jgi:hypothetical protein
MDAAIVVALVAGFVSLISVVANIYIARQARNTAMLQPKVQAIVSRTSETDTLLKNYAAEIERLRIRIWNLLGHLDDIRLNPDREAVYENLKNTIPTFIEGARTFESAWAPVKGEMPQGIEHYIRSVRHDCLSDIVTVMGYMHLTLSILERQPNDEDLKELMNSFKVSTVKLKDALPKLDDLISLVRAVRENVAVGLNSDLPAKSNKSFNPTPR